MADTPDPFSGLAPNPMGLAETASPSGSMSVPSLRRPRPALWFALGVGATVLAGGACLLARDLNKGSREMAVLTQMAATIARGVDLCARSPHPAPCRPTLTRWV